MEKDLSPEERTWDYHLATVTGTSDTNIFTNI